MSTGHLKSLAITIHFWCPEAGKLSHRVQRISKIFFFPLQVGKLSSNKGSQGTYFASPAPETIRSIGKKEWRLCLQTEQGNGEKECLLKMFTKFLSGTLQLKLRHSLKVSLPPQPPRPRAPGWRKRSKCPTIQRASQTSVDNHRPTTTMQNQRSHLNRSTKWQNGRLTGNDSRRKLEHLMKDLKRSRRPSLTLLKKTILSTFSSLTLSLLGIPRSKNVMREQHNWVHFVSGQRQPWLGTNRRACSSTKRGVPQCR